MKLLPIRIRLTLWYFVMFATAACLLSTASWWMLRRSVDANEYHDLQERAEDVQSLLLHEAPDRSIADLSQEFTQLYSIKDDGKWLQIMDEDGRWIYRSKRMLSQNPALARPGDLPQAGTVAEFLQGTRYVRTLAYPIAVHGRKYSVQTGIALNKSMTLLSSFGADLILLTPAVILLAALGGHWMSRKALRPVAVLADEARRINDRNLEIRLPASATRDEISDLSATLNQMLERIDKAFASVRAFTGNASHELRTPIALLRTEIEVALIRPRGAEEYKATLMHLHQTAVQMSNLIENLLSIARADANAEIVRLEPFDLNDFFGRLRRDWTGGMHLAGLNFHTKIPDAGLTALGDPTTLNRLLTILLENARKYTAAGGSVVLSAASDGAGIQIAVQDTGIGISQQDLPRIFDRFFRGDQAGVEESSGSGLGLALGKWICEKHGTELVVRSAPGQGSCFSFTLPSASEELRKTAGSLTSLMRDEEVKV